MLVEEKIMDSVEINVTVTCHFCSKEEEYTLDKGEERDVTSLIMSKLQEEGWDHLRSAKRVYLACPDCLDEESGD